ncbi:hypothetical protein AK812_SmicGene32423 [Symbiodinium microadriaticum]|uniref:Uncharacterized protein n=1 Tax=Symbiodinium microadriaticum TaxID=2951 RepID=A0A1Q9CU57_SYMMI|nr:hypothetical protein AK812_SmicGene32423 [Symbiodinium microadriaticum]
MDPDALWFASHLVLSSQLARNLDDWFLVATPPPPPPTPPHVNTPMQLRSEDMLDIFAAPLDWELLCTDEEHSLGGSADAEDAGSMDADDDALATRVPDAHEVASPSCSLEDHAAPADEDTLVSTTAPADDDSLLSSAAPADEDSVVSSTARPCPSFAELCALPKLAARSVRDDDSSQDEDDPQASLLHTTSDAGSDLEDLESVPSPEDNVPQQLPEERAMDADLAAWQRQCLAERQQSDREVESYDFAGLAASGSSKA